MGQKIGNSHVQPVTQFEAKVDQSIQQKPAAEAGHLTVDNSTNKITDLNFQSAQRKFALTANQANACLNVHTATPVADNLPEKAYDGMYVGANGQAYSSNTPLSQIPAVMPRKGATLHHTILYVNGITTDKPGQFSNMQVIANTTGAPIIGIHNSTEGAANDIKQCALDKIDCGLNPAHDTLTKTILSELKQGHSVHIMAHSQGGLITARSLARVETILYKQEIAKRGSMLNPFIKSAANEEVQRLLGKITVETFGAASTAYIDGPHYIHYINNADNVPVQLGLGSSDMAGTGMTQPGKNATVLHFRAEFPGQKKFNDYFARDPKEWPGMFGTDQGMDKFLAPHSIDAVYMSYRIPPAQATREGSHFISTPAHPLRRVGMEVRSTP